MANPSTTRRKILICITFLIGGGGEYALQAQSYAYIAGLYSTPKAASTARVRGLGNASVALGGIVGAAELNPAALGFFRRHALQISPEMRFYDSRMQLSGPAQEGRAIRPGIISLSGLYSDYAGDYSSAKLRSQALMISITRSQNAFEKFNYLVPNASQTLLDYYTEQAQGLSNTQLAEDWGLAPLQAHHLLESTGTNSYHSLLEGEVAKQHERYYRYSTHHQFSVAYGLSYQDQIYIGASAALGFVHYKRNRDYSEGYSRILNEIKVLDELKLRGNSLQIGLGLIYRPLPALRLGLSVQAPTLYRLREKSTYDWESNFDNYTYTAPNGEETILNRLSYQSDLLKSTYTLRTPMHLHTGLAYFFGKWGFLSGQVSWVDYRSMRVGTRDFNATTTNQRIRQDYRSAANYHLGAELRPIPPLYLRTGYAYYSAISAHGNANQSYSFGTGIQNEMYDISLAIEQTQNEETYAPFELSGSSTLTGRLHTRAISLFLTTVFFLYK